MGSRQLLATALLTAPALAACGGGSSGGAGTEAAAAVDDAVDDAGDRRSPTTGAAEVTTTVGSGARTPSTSDGSSAAPVSFDELLRRRQELVGGRVRVIGEALFEAVCPPPGPSGQAQPCVLTLYLAAPGTRTIDASTRAEAIAMAEGGEPVSCPEGSSPAGGCPGWEHGRTYEITAEVQHQVLGGRETEGVQLDVVHKQAN